jgi:hypothetical protein
MSNDLEATEKDLSPAMLACLPKERLAIEYRMQGFNFSVSVAKAGYGVGSTPEVLAKIAYRLFRRDRVLEAMLEQAKVTLRNNTPEALEALRDILGDRQHKDRLRASLAVLEHSVGAPVQKIDVSHTHTIVDPDQQAIAYLRYLMTLNVSEQTLLDALGPVGLPRYRAAMLAEDKAKLPVIEADYVELDPDLLELEQLMGGPNE